jgi:polar amino acid transport system permease protein/octopine/nopaline transport system permease protein
MAAAFPKLARGFGLTLALSAAALALGAMIAYPLAVAKCEGNAFVRRTVDAYILAFRGTPALVQIALLYYGLAQFETVRNSFMWPVLRDPFWVCVIALGLNTGAYTTQLLAGAFRAVPGGLLSAAKALGMTRWQVLLTVRLPIGMRLALPAYGNEVILLVKATSLASTVTLLELTGTARLLVSDTYAPYEVFAAAALCYLALTWSLGRLFRHLERTLRVGAGSAGGGGSPKPVPA